MKQGLVHLYYGEGKGKTTAAVGLAVRAAGAGARVLFTQFLKGGPSGEIEILLALPGVAVLREAQAQKFSWNMTEEEKRQAALRCEEMLARAFLQAKEGAYDLLVLDEAVGASALGFLREDALLLSLKERPQGLEVALTGRAPTPALLEIADYATEMRKVKHPFDRGVRARKGVEY